MLLTLLYRALGSSIYVAWLTGSDVVRWGCSQKSKKFQLWRMMFQSKEAAEKARKIGPTAD